MKLQQKSDFLSTRVQYISTTRIRPNPQQPRRSFPEDALAELAESIRRYGILQPLTVRRAGGDFELIAGERRLRAARLAGLREVPCLIARVGEEDSALLALIENLQRRDLDYWEEADALARLIRRYDLTQEQAAEKLGKSQSTVANKLRLLRLPEPVRAAAQKYALTARHARALLRLPDGEEPRLASARRAGTSPRRRPMWKSGLPRCARSRPRDAAPISSRTCACFSTASTAGCGSCTRRASPPAGTARTPTARFS